MAIPWLPPLLVGIRLPRTTSTSPTSLPLVKLRLVASCPLKCHDLAIPSFSRLCSCFAPLNARQANNVCGHRAPGPSRNGAALRSSYLQRSRRKNPWRACSRTRHRHPRRKNPSRYPMTCWIGVRRQNIPARTPAVPRLRLSIDTVQTYSDSLVSSYYAISIGKIS